MHWSDWLVLVLLEAWFSLEVAFRSQMGLGFERVIERVAVFRLGEVVYYDVSDWGLD